MAIDFRKELNARLDLLTKSIEDIEKKSKSFPEGWINIRCRNGRFYYYFADADDKDRYLAPKDDASLIGQLIQKDYLNKVLKDAKTERAAILKMLRLYPETVAEDVYDSLPEGRKQYATPINICDEAFAQKWMQTPYKRKPFKKGAPVFTTIKGERVRSKSEAMIADRLFARGIPYRYECPLKVGNKIIHPDFTILRMSDRKILYHEHCGKMDDEEYKEDMVERANGYSEAGIILGDRLFYTFESEKTPLDMRTFDRIIDTHFR